MENNTEEVEIFETTRKLASVQIIKEIKSHDNSDNLALATILGWQVVIKKGEFKEGQKVIYFEIDSLLPDKEWSEFLKDKHFRIKTIKLRGEISQGLLMPLSILGDDINEDDYEEGLDLTKTIGVQKYCYDADESTIIIGKNGEKIERKVKVSTFPDHLIQKSDEPRIQGSPKLLNHFKGKPYYAALKYDGTSATYLLNPEDPEDFMICSRNQRREYDLDDVYSVAADKYKIKEKLKELGPNYIIQCEIFGMKVQKNLFNMNSIAIAIFTVYDMETKTYLNFQETIDFCTKFDLPMVEVIDKGDEFNYSIDDLKKLSKGCYTGTKNAREGLVFRLQENWIDKYNRYSFKIINDDYLMKN
jgi:RNA ligase (TIGR02306 family)